MTPRTWASDVQPASTAARRRAGGVRGMSQRRWILWIAAVGIIGGCGQGPSGTGPNGPRGEGKDRLHQQAIDALARYDAAVLAAGGSQVFVPVGELTGQVGDWEPQNGDNKAALMSGQVVTTATLPAAPQGNGTVRW